MSERMQLWSSEEMANIPVTDHVETMGWLAYLAYLALA